MRTVAWLAIAFCTGCAGSAPELDENKLVDLSYAFDEQTVYWPTATRFALKEVAHGHTAGGYFYASNDYSASEHGGTHVDAPIHFAEGKRTADQIPLPQLVGPARVIDVRQAASANPDYLLAPADIAAYEEAHGQIARGDIVLIHTGWGARYPDAKRYLGSDVRGRVENLHFPGIGAEAARLLVERGVDAVGLDTASLDHGPSTDFIAHQILNGANIPGFENVANLDRLPPEGATVIALPMKIAGGSGAPCRIVALLPRD